LFHRVGLSNSPFPRIALPNTVNLLRPASIISPKATFHSQKVIITFL
jgi:hypothetical protein